MQEGSKCDRGCTRSLAILLKMIGFKCDCPLQFGRGCSVGASARRVYVRPRLYSFLSDIIKKDRL